MSLAGAIDLLADAALALLYPHPCAACGVESVEARADAPACADCWRATRVFTGEETLCWKCGALAPRDVPDEKRGGVRCRRCEGESFTAARACGLYEGALRAAVLELKREPFVSSRLAGLLAAARARPPLNSATLVVPVPLHAERERERGFNQAAAPAGALSKQTGLRLAAWSLARAAG